MSDTVHLEAVPEGGSNANENQPQVGDTRRGFLQKLGGLFALAGTASLVAPGCSPSGPVDSFEYDEKTDATDAGDIMDGKPSDIDEDTWRSFHPATRNYYRDPNSETSKQIFYGMPASYNHEQGRELWVRMTPEFRNTEREIYEEMHGSGMTDEKGQPTSQETEQSVAMKRFWQEAWKQPALQGGAVVYEHISKNLLGPLINMFAKSEPADLMSLDADEVQKLLEANDKVKTIATVLRTGSVAVADGGVATMGGGALLVSDFLEALHELGSAASHIAGGRMTDAGGSTGAALGNILGNAAGMGIWYARMKKGDLTNIDLPSIAALERNSDRLKKAIERFDTRSAAAQDAEDKLAAARQKIELAKAAGQAALEEAGAKRELARIQREQAEIEKDLEKDLISIEEAKRKLAEEKAQTAEAERIAAEAEQRYQEALKGSNDAAKAAAKAAKDAADANLEAEKAQDALRQQILDQAKQREQDNSGN